MTFIKASLVHVYTCDYYSFVFIAVISLHQTLCCRSGKKRLIGKSEVEKFRLYLFSHSPEVRRVCCYLNNRDLTILIIVSQIEFYGYDTIYESSAETGIN